MRVAFGLLFCVFTAGQAFSAENAARQMHIEKPLAGISWAAASVDSWRYMARPDENAVDVHLPVLSIDGKRTPVVLRRLDRAGDPVSLRNGATELTYEGVLESDDAITLQVRFRVSEDNPVVKFCYALKASGGQKLTKTDGKDDLVYLAYSMRELPKRKEVRLSVFNEMIHSCNLSEAPLCESDFDDSTTAVGPILLGSNEHSSFLCAYEHDSMYQDRYVEYRLQPGGNVAVCAVKGNYFDGQPVDGYSTIWFEVAGAKGGEDELASAYRTFALKFLSNNTESRKPYIYYNTWGRQERVKWAGGQYLDTMNLDYTLREIDRAHAMGIEIYVLDAGWFDKTGDWGVNLKAFPDGLSEVRKKLDGYGMQLGVWMNPEKAAVSSRALQENGSCVRTRNGKAEAPYEVWETEPSVSLCLASPYWKCCADTIVRLYKDLGVHYFYFDGISQGGCDDPGHLHGSAPNSAKEREESLGFLKPVYLGKIVDRVTDACPGAIFDFDTTEPRRIGVGLQWLASGRFFALNNGPYFNNFDLCPRGKSLLPSGCHNIFINPGPARTWFMRSVLDYDRWIPSNLFMANYQPDDPANSQLLNLASLVLGQNGVWGDILKTSPEGVALFHDILSKYKEIRDDVAAASPIHIGNPGDSPEIFEKINPQTGKGVIAIFANQEGTFTYVTRNRLNDALWHNEGITTEALSDGRARITAEFTKPSAKIVFFGVSG